jgi:hypothetical protein
MFISRISLPRRTFLRGVGAALGLPLLDAMVPALSAFADTPANRHRAESRRRDVSINAPARVEVSLSA